MAPQSTSQTLRTFHLRELLSLGLKKGLITNIVQKAGVFRDIPRQQGYAIDYSFNQAVLLHVGNELSGLGVSFRHINKILFDLAGLDFEKDREKIARGRLVMFIFGKVFSREEEESLKEIRARIAGKSPGAGRSSQAGKPVRMASINLRLLRERDASRMDDALDDYVRINLHKIVERIAGLA